MITAQIEKALIKGDAKLKTFMLATSAVGRIEVPTNNFIIITSITCYPFSDSSGSFGNGSLTDIDGRSTHIVELINQDSDRVGFIFRNQFQIADTYTINSEPITYDTFLVRSKSVFISIGCYQGLYHASAADYKPLNSNVQIPKNPTGYGDTSSVYADIQDALGNYYSPAQPAPMNQPYRNQPFPFYHNDDGDTGVLAAAVQNNETPVIQITYVQMNEQARANFQ